MAINRLCNRRCGPGGGTRRLHHFFIWGRNRIDVRSKDTRFARHGTTVSGLNFISGIISSTSTRAGARRRAANNNAANRNSRFAVTAQAA
jgi:hypothetical protein